VPAKLNHRSPKGKSNEQGFTLAEVVLSMGIIAITLTLFALMLTNTANLQSELDEQRIAERIIYGEAEEIAAMRWDNIMPNPVPNTYATCQLDGDIYSTQAVNPGPETITVDNLELSITRSIVWYLSGNNVECTDENKLRAEPKEIIITATWNGQTGPETKTLTIVRSKWAEAPLTGEARGRTGEIASTVYTEGFSNSGVWCNSYTTDSGENISPGTASLQNGGLNIELGADQTGICGIVLTGLTPGTIYTAVATVAVPSEQTAVSLSVDGVNNGPLAIPSAGDRVLTISWVETTSERRIGFTVPEPFTSEIGDGAFISSFRVYANN